MRAWAVHTPGAMATWPLGLLQRPVPEPGSGELLLRVLACGVCRTDLHVAGGDLPPHLPGVTPGHEVVGMVTATGPGCRHAIGDRVGVAWLRGTCGECRYCTRGAENLCPFSVYTGWDAAGGHDHSTTAPADHAPRLPAGDRGGTLAIAGIDRPDVPDLNDQLHLFQERQGRSDTANTGAESAEFLR